MPLSLQAIMKRSCSKCGQVKKNTKSVRAHPDEEEQYGKIIHRIICRDCYIESFQVNEDTDEGPLEPLNKKEAAIQWNLITTDGSFQ